jgi:signal transduction histidine kinase
MDQHDGTGATGVDPATTPPSDEHEALLAFLYAAPVGLVQTDPSGQVLLMNGAAAALLAPLARARGRPQDLDNLFDLLQARAPELRELARAEPAAQNVLCQDLQLQLSGPDQALRVASLRLVRLDRHRLMATFTDVTDRVLAEHNARHARELEAENRRLQQLARLKDRFVATMSHELRTPLTSVLGYVELLRTGRVAPGSPRQASCLDRITHNATHLLMLIDDLLDLGALEADRLEFHPQTLDLAVLAGEVRQVLAGEWQAKRHEVLLAVDPALGALHLDPARLRQVVYHLMSNAVKFTPEGGRIALQARALHGGWFELAVQDNGIGIAPHQLPLVFTDFHQLDGDNTRRNEGTGLGLGLTRRLVRAQGGDISVHSTPGEGSVFTVRLPQRHTAG